MEPAGSTMMSNPEAKTVNVAFVGAPHEPGPPVPLPTAEPRTAVEASADTGRAPPKNWVMSGVRNGNRGVAVTVRMLPAPVPPAAAAHVIVVPAGVRQAVAIGPRAPSPWVWLFFSWTARACIPAVSVGCTAP